MKTTLASLLLLSLVACTSTPAEWVKPGASKDDAYTTLSECKYQIGLAKVPSGEHDPMVAHCMRGKGYRYVAITPPAK